MALLDVKLKNALVCSGIGTLPGNREGLAIFGAARYCTPLGGFRPPLQGFQVTGPRTGVEWVPSHLLPQAQSC